MYYFLTILPFDQKTSPYVGVEAEILYFTITGVMGLPILPSLIFTHKQDKIKVVFNLPNSFLFSIH
jgi:hypothetical protein